MLGFHVHAPSPEDSLVTCEAVARLRAALPDLCRFVVMGGWLNLGRPGWAGTRVTPQGLLVLQSDPVDCEGDSEGSELDSDPWLSDGLPAGVGELEALRTSFDSSLGEE